MCRAVDLVGGEEVVEVGIADNSLNTVVVGDRNKATRDMDMCCHLLFYTIKVWASICTFYIIASMVKLVSSFLHLDGRDHELIPPTKYRFGRYR